MDLRNEAFSNGQTPEYFEDLYYLILYALTNKICTIELINIILEESTRKMIEIKIDLLSRELSRSIFIPKPRKN